MHRPFATLALLTCVALPIGAAACSPSSHPAVHEDVSVAPPVDPGGGDDGGGAGGGGGSGGGGSGGGGGGGGGSGGGGDGGQAPVPEPATLALFAGGIAALALLRRRRRAV